MLEVEPKRGLSWIFTITDSGRSSGRLICIGNRRSSPFLYLANRTKWTRTYIAMFALFSFSKVSNWPR